MTEKEDKKDENKIEETKEEKPEETKEEKKEETKVEKKEEQNDSDYIKITDDGGVKKKIIKEGSGDKAAEGNEVKVNYIGKNGSKIFDQTKDKPFSFKIGAHSVIKGWEIGVKTMKVGEKAEFIFSPEYAYGKQKVSELIPENSTLNFEIELIEIEGKKKEIDDMEYEEKLEKGKKYKEEGVEKYKQGDYKGAREKFDEAAKYLDKYVNKYAEKEKEGCQVYQSVLTNLCNCCHKLKEYYALIIYANLAIKINNELPKLFYFRAIALAQTSEFEKAEKDIESLEKLLSDKEKENAGIDNIREMIKRKREETNSHRKKFSKGLFGHDIYKDAGPQKPIPPPDEPNPKNPIVFLDIKIGQKDTKRIKIELFEDKVPITSNNFKSLCTGEKNITYKGSKIFRIVKNVMIQGGDFEKNDGTGGTSIYGEKFDDENFYYSHSRSGLLSMANKGKNTNGSQFFITLKDTTWYDEKHVVFGKIINGYDIIKEIEGVKINDDDIPEEDIIIENCGEIKDGIEIDPVKMKEILEKERIEKEKQRKKREEEERIEKEKKEKEKEEKENDKKYRKRRESDSSSSDSDKEEEKKEEEKRKREEEKRKKEKEEELKELMEDEDAQDEISENTIKNKEAEDKK